MATSSVSALSSLSSSRRSIGSSGVVVLLWSRHGPARRRCTPKPKWQRQPRDSSINSANIHKSSYQIVIGTDLFFCVFKFHNGSFFFLFATIQIPQKTMMRISIRVHVITKDAIPSACQGAVAVCQALICYKDEFIFVASFRSVGHTQVNARRMLVLALILAIADQGGAREVAATTRRRIISAVSIVMVSHDETESNDLLTSRRSTTLRCYS